MKTTPRQRHDEDWPRIYAVVASGTRSRVALDRMSPPGAASSRLGSPVFKSTATLDPDLAYVMNVPLPTLSPSWLPGPTELVVRWTPSDTASRTGSVARAGSAETQAGRHDP